MNFLLNNNPLLSTEWPLKWLLEQDRRGALCIRRIEIGSQELTIRVSGYSDLAAHLATTHLATTRVPPVAGVTIRPPLIHWPTVKLNRENSYYEFWQ